MVTGCLSSQDQTLTPPVFPYDTRGLHLHFGEDLRLELSALTAEVAQCFAASWEPVSRSRLWLDSESETQDGQ